LPLSETLDERDRRPTAGAPALTAKELNMSQPGAYLDRAVTADWDEIRAALPN
jgi:hypothetical protein